MKNVISLYLFCLFSISYGSIQAKTTLPTIRKIDSTALKEYKNNPNYQYDVEVQEDSGESFLSQLLRALSFDMSGIAQVFLKVLEILIYIIFGGLLVYLLFLILGINIDLRRRKIVGNVLKNTSTELDFEKLDITTIDFDALIRKAESAGEYEQAVRFLYWRVLQKLYHLQLIAWQPFKTNAEYLRELSTDLQKKFHPLLYYFEFVHYGNFSIAAQEYDTLKAEFLSFPIAAP